MAELRRQGITNEKIAQRFGCSERSVRRKLRHVRVQIDLPRDPEPDADLDRIRTRLMDEFTSLLTDEFELCWSVTLIDEAHYRLERRLARVHPRTLRLMPQSQEIRWRFYAEVVGPLHYDMAPLYPGGVGSVTAPPYLRPPYDRLDRLVWSPQPDLTDESDETTTGLP